jgi:CDP-paratose 2-epimerase
MPTRPTARVSTRAAALDATLHSLVGVSKLAADVMVQEHGRYFDMPTVCFRRGCLTGPNHWGAELHGFLAYLARALREGRVYRIYGYKGKQARDNIHSYDVCTAFEAFYRPPRLGGGLQPRGRTG